MNNYHCCATRQWFFKSQNVSCCKQRLPTFSLRVLLQVLTIAKLHRRNTSKFIGFANHCLVHKMPHGNRVCLLLWFICAVSASEWQIFASDLDENIARLDTHAFSGRRRVKCDLISGFSVVRLSDTYVNKRHFSLEWEINYLVLISLAWVFEECSVNNVLWWRPKPKRSVKRRQSPNDIQESLLKTSWMAP